MTETEKMEKQGSAKVEVITSYNNVPYFLVGDELNVSEKTEYNTEMAQINEYYKQYRKGVEFISEGSNGDYIPSNLKFKKASSILNKEARFLFANPPTFNVNIDDVDGKMKDENTIIQDYLDKVLKKNYFNGKLVKAGKDCLIGKRVAIVLNFNEKSGISITFHNSLEFVYEVADHGNNQLQRITTFHNQNKTINKSEQRWFKKTYELINDVVYVTDTIYDGLGTEIEKVTPRRKTKFTYIPAVVVLNDGLTGDTEGESELEYLLNYEGSYSKLANADIDAGRKNMNPIRYAIDASQGSTENLSSAPGAFWDIQSDDEKASDSVKASVGIIESNLSYSGALKTTLDRIENAMYAEVDVPNINGEQLQGLITSGKTLSALYWGLTVRCDEKMLAWAPALEFIANAIIDGGRLYPKTITRYTDISILPDIEVDVLVENNYPLPEDENEEKNMDLAEVGAQVMSKKSYLKKWRKLSDKEADEELEQIALEINMFENGQMMPETDMSDLGGSEGEEDIDLESGEFALEEDDDSEVDAMFDSFLSEIEADDEGMEEE